MSEREENKSTRYVAEGCQENKIRIRTVEFIVVDFFQALKLRGLTFLDFRPCDLRRTAWQRIWYT